MSTTLNDKFTPILKEIIAKYEGEKSNRIYVFIGITSYVDLDSFADHITDKDTFDKEGNDKLFNKEWFGNIFLKLNTASSYQILTHQQFSYITNYINNEFFQDRIVIVYDNLRLFFPIEKKDYLEYFNDDDSNEKRPDGLPIYQAEQQKIGDKYYYSLINFRDSFASQEFFSKTRKLQISKSSSEYEVLDVVSNHYSIDEFVNKCIEENDFSKQILVKVGEKNILSRTIYNILERLNHLLGMFGGELYEQLEDAIHEDYIPQPHTIELLRKYWGENANFRKISFYANPGINNELVQISQGSLVETIINEYENGRKDILPRDIFITAPTGAGKSLIFQLPAIYAAEKGDVTIVVSPLIELMRDQVESLRFERHFNKVEFINSELSLIERGKVLENFQKGDADILYLSPELLLSYNIHYFLGERKLGLLVVDEAHLITTWGRDFRVDYWFLGNHINKIRKFNDYKFPLVALTATAVYGGVNDMVFDSINSLNMYNSHKFIGNVKRNDIEFVLDTHDDYKSSYEDSKVEETINFIKGIHNLGIKGIVYAPYRTHVNKLYEKAKEIDSTMTVPYHGGNEMSKDQKKMSSYAFRNNECKIMIATKAFGMGIDIPDIQVVYHHAPSGLLPDYVQEIGRVARREDIHGFAALTFSKSDLRYSKQLFGISSLKQFQLQEVLRKIYRCFKMNEQGRNMLVSANDFAYIFNTTEELEQKVKTALMMIEKDYLEKTRFNVLIARPKNLFTKVYARTDEIGIDKLYKLYGDCFTKIRLQGNYHLIKLDLNRIWSEYFSDKSFPQLKTEFFHQYFLRSEGIELCPQIKVKITINQSFQKIYAELNKIFEAATYAFSTLKHRGSVFEQKDFVEILQSYLEKYNIEKITEFILVSYSGKLKSPGVLEGDSFLQQRRIGNSTKYQVFAKTFDAKFTRLLNIFSQLFDSGENKTAESYRSKDSMINYTRLGSLLDLMMVGTFETAGGEEPKIFLRLNDPHHIERDAFSHNYKNSILESVEKRHKVSCKLFEHFFTNYFSSEKRWDLIEDFFLGMSNDDLFEKYLGTSINHVNIIDYLKANAQIPSNAHSHVKGDSQNSLEQFKPRANKSYFRDNYLAIENRVMAIKDWLKEDPVSLHRTIVEYKIGIDKEDYVVLMSKLKANFFPYYRDFMGLNLLINFPNYSSPIKASIPYKDSPIKFYKWWKVNQEKVKLNHTERVKLFFAIYDENPKLLLKEHRKVIGK